MNIPTHQLPAETLAALGTGGGGAEAVQPLVAAQYSQRLLLVWAVRTITRETGHPQAGHAGRGFELLADVQRQAPGAVEAVLRHPSVGAWADRALRGLLSGEQVSGQQVSGRQLSGGLPGRAGGEPAQLAAIAAAAAIRARYPCAIEVPIRRGVITLPSVGQVTLAPGAVPDGMANVRYTAEGARVIAGRRLIRIPADTRADTPGWRGLRAIRATARELTLRLVVDDLDPDRMPSAGTLGGRLSPAEATRWQRLLPPAWDLLTDQPGTTADEIHAALQVLTPLRRPSHGQVSATSRAAFGGVALSPPADALALAVSLAQEVQHAKLGAVLDLVPLIEPDDGQRYGAPWCAHPRCADAWCEDARRDGGRCDRAGPIGGLLERAYGCLGVTGFWRWQRLAEDRAAAARAHLEYLRWRDAAATATTVLGASGRLTDAGHIFVGGMAATLQAWADEKMPAAWLPRARMGHELPWNQLKADTRGVRMAEETAVLVPEASLGSAGLGSAGLDDPGLASAVLDGAVLGEAVLGDTVLGDTVLGDTVLGSAVLDDVLVDEVLADDLARDAVLPAQVAGNGVPDLSGMSLRDLDSCDQPRLAAAARRLVNPGRDGR